MKSFKNEDYFRFTSLNGIGLKVFYLFEKERISLCEKYALRDEKNNIIIEKNFEKRSYFDYEYLIRINPEQKDMFNIELGMLLQKFGPFVGVSEEVISSFLN